MTSHPNSAGWLFYFVSNDKRNGRISRIMRASEEVEKDHQKSVMERIVFATTVQYQPLNENFHIGLCCDLSVGGIYLRTELAFNLDEILALSFSIPYQEDPVLMTCNARVAWTNDSSYRRKPTYPPGAGLQFLELSQEQRATLAKFIEAYDEDKKMNVLCAWCGSNLGMRKGPVGTTSHGICNQCRKQFEQKMTL